MVAFGSMNPLDGRNKKGLEEHMTSLDKLQAVIDKSLDAVKQGQFKSIGLALADGMQDIVSALKEIIIAPDSSPTIRFKAVTMMLSIWERALNANLREEKIRANKERSRAKTTTAQATRAQALAEKQKITLAQAQEHKRNRRKVERAMAVLKGGHKNG